MNLRWSGATRRSSENSPLSQVAVLLEDVLQFPVSKHLTLFSINDDSSFNICTNLASKKVIFAGLTAAKKQQQNYNSFLVFSWTSFNKEWNNYFRDIVLIERSLAVIHKARSYTLDVWDKVIEKNSQFKVVIMSSTRTLTLFTCWYLIITI